LGRHVQGLARRLRLAVDLECPAEGFTMSVKQTEVPRTLAVLPRGNFAAIIPGDSVAETVITSGIANTLNLYQSALIVRVILTWFPQAPQAVVNPLSTICDPYLNLFRGLIPPIGGTFDLSPILAFVVLDFLTGSAASLGAEMPEGKTSTSSRD
jgi:YggT family protein